MSPWRTTTAPPACFAIRPVSNEISLPAISTESRVTALLLMLLPSCPPSVGGASGLFSIAERRCYPVSLAITSAWGFRAGSCPAAIERRRLGRSGPHAARVSAHGAATASASRRSCSKRTRSSPSAWRARHRCGSSVRPGSANRASWNSQKRSCRPAASAAQASVTARGCRPRSRNGERPPQRRRAQAPWARAHRGRCSRRKR